MLTAGLFCALLLVLNGVVYEATQVTLLQSLRESLQHETVAFAQAIDTGQAIPYLHLTSTSWSAQGIAPTGAGANGFSLIVVDPHLSHALGIDSSFRMQALDPTAVARAMDRRLGSPFSTRRLDGSDPVLIYTAPIEGHSGPVRGVLQMSLSEQQYLSSLVTLRTILLVVSGLGLAAAAALSGMLARYAVGPIRAALRRQRDFVADAAHELRTPLAIMRTATELGLTSDAADDQTAALEQNLQQNVHLTELVTSLSLLARADSGVVPLTCASVELKQLAGETVSSVTFLAEYKEVALTLDAPDELVVLGDAGRLRQLILILLDNALKYTPPGGSIVVGVVRQGTRALLRVQDSGAGIAPADLPYLFDRFYRADRARSSDGTGLGLAIGRWIAEAHEGRISAATAPNGGAIFTVSLPLAP